MVMAKLAGVDQSNTNGCPLASSFGVKGTVVINNTPGQTTYTINIPEGIENLKPGMIIDGPNFYSGTAILTNGIDLVNKTITISTPFPSNRDASYTYPLELKNIVFKTNNIGKTEKNITISPDGTPFRNRPLAQTIRELGWRPSKNDIKNAVNQLAQSGFNISASTVNSSNTLNPEGKQISLNIKYNCGNTSFMTGSIGISLPLCDINSDGTYNFTSEDEKIQSGGPYHNKKIKDIKIINTEAAAKAIAAGYERALAEAVKSLLAEPGKTYRKSCWEFGRYCTETPIDEPWKTIDIANGCFQDSLSNNPFFSLQAVGITPRPVDKTTWNLGTRINTEPIRPDWLPAFYIPSS